MLQQFPFLGAGYLQPTPHARAAQGFAKEFTVRRVDQRVRLKNFLQAREGPPGRQKQPAAFQPVSLLLQVDFLKGALPPATEVAAAQTLVSL